MSLPQTLQSYPLDLTVGKKEMRKKTIGVELSDRKNNSSIPNPETQNKTNCSDDASEAETAASADSNHFCNLSLLHHQSRPNFLDDSCRRHRTAFSRTQTARLEKEFQKDNYLSRTKRMDLAKELNLYENTIKVRNQPMEAAKSFLNFASIGLKVAYLSLRLIQNR